MGPLQGQRRAGSAVPVRLSVAVSVSATPERDPRPSGAPASSPRLHVVGRSGGGAEQPSAGDRPCTCGHGKAAHTHYRKGTDCSLCTCPRYDRPFRLRVGPRRRGR